MSTADHSFHFHYNSGSLRGRASARSWRPLPVQLVSPAGKTALGVPRGAFDSRESNSEQDLVGPVVLFTAPRAEEVGIGRRMLLLSAALGLTYVALNIAVLGESISDDAHNRDIRFLPHSLATAWSFIRIAVIAIGAYGIRTRDPHILTLFGCIVAVDAFLGFSNFDGDAALARDIVSLSLAILALHFRNSMMARWFSTTRL